MSHRIAMLALCMLGAMTLAAPAAAQSSMDPVIVVTGEGLVKAVPDVAWVTIGAESRSKSPKDAQAQNATAMSGVHEKLTGAGIPADAIRTTRVQLEQEFDFVDGKRVSRGYVARNAIEVRVDDIARVGSVLDMAVGTGATSVESLRFDVKDRQKLERDALRLAVTDARARAEAAASGAGATLGRVLRIEEPGVASPPPPMPMMARTAYAEKDASTPVSPGEIEIRAQVTLTAGIQ